MENMQEIDINKLTQYQYNHLLSTLAKSVGTVKRFITVEKAQQADNGDGYYTVRCKGFAYLVILHGYKLCHVARAV